VAWDRDYGVFIQVNGNGSSVSQSMICKTCISSRDRESERVTLLSYLLIVLHECI
jgi:hypothetical protein